MQVDEQMQTLYMPVSKHCTYARGKILEDGLLSSMHIMPIAFREAEPKYCCGASWKGG